MPTVRPERLAPLGRPERLAPLGRPGRPQQVRQEHLGRPEQQERPGHHQEHPERRQRHPRHPPLQRHRQQRQPPSSCPRQPWPQPCASSPLRRGASLPQQPCARPPRGPASPHRPSHAQGRPGTQGSAVPAARRRPGWTHGTSVRYPEPGCARSCPRCLPDGCSHRR